MSEAAVEKAKIQTGGLDLNLAIAACYAPFAMINLIASVLFLASEPKENREIRFHAAQGLLLYGSWVLATLVSCMIFIALPLVLGVFGTVIAGALNSDAIASLFGMLAVLCYLLGFFLVIVVSLGGLAALLGAAVMGFLEKPVRIPVLAGLAERLTA